MQIFLPQIKKRGIRLGYEFEKLNLGMNKTNDYCLKIELFSSCTLTAMTDGSQTVFDKKHEPGAKNGQACQKRFMPSITIKEMVK